MKKLLISAAIAATAMLVPTVASAHNAGPCNDSGGPGHSDYARHHIVEATPGHVPGVHQGYSFCLGVHD